MPMLTCWTIWGKTMKLQDKISLLLSDNAKKGQADTNQPFSGLSVATAVLFLEMAYADFNLSPEEETKISTLLQDFFSLDGQQVSELIRVAREKRESRTDIWLFTNQIKKSFSRPQKQCLLENLWRLVYADGYMDKYEEALMRKITNLIGMTHGEMIEARQLARS